MSEPIKREFWKHPDAVVDIVFKLVSDDTDTVATVDDVVIAPSGTLISPSTSVSGARLAVWLSGGTDGADYELVVTFTTVNGRTEVGQAIIHVRA